MIQVEVNDREARCQSPWPITSGSVGLAVSFGFSEDWEGLSAVAVFRGSGTEADVALSGTDCAVPAAVLSEAGGSLWIGVYGQAENGARVIPTIWACAGRIEQGTEPSGFEPADPAPSWSAQVQAAAAEALAKAAVFPAGGTAGQVLRKRSGTDYDTEWAGVSGGGGGAVDSVNGKTGVVVLDKSDLGLGSVDNTSDSAKKTAFTGEIAADDTGFVTGGEVYDALNDLNTELSMDLALKQDLVLASGILKGDGEGGVTAAAAGTDYGTYSKPSGGIPDSDIASAATWNAKGSYSKPSGGIPKTDLASDVQTSLGKADTALQEHQSLSGYATQTWVGQQGYLTQHQDVSGKEDKAAVVTQSAPTALTLADNTVYYLSNVSSLTLSYPASGHWECLIVLSTASSGTVTVTLPSSSYIGSAPSFGTSQTWELSIRDGVVVAGKAESA